MHAALPQPAPVMARTPAPGRAVPPPAPVEHSLEGLILRRTQLTTTGVTQYTTSQGNFYRFPAGTHHTNSTNRPRFPAPASALVVYSGAGNNGVEQVHTEAASAIGSLLGAMHTEGQRIDDESLKQAVVASGYRPSTVAEGRLYLNALRKTIRENPTIFPGMTFPASMEATAISELGTVGSATHDAFVDALGRESGWTPALARQLVSITSRFKAPRGGSPHQSGCAVDIDFPFATSAASVQNHGMDRNKNANAFRAAAGVWLNQFSRNFGFDTYDTSAEIWHQEWLDWPGTPADPSYQPPAPQLPPLPAQLPAVLPYRQSINLLRCIEIMGEQNGEYCRRQIARELERGGRPAMGREQFE